MRDILEIIADICDEEIVKEKTDIDLFKAGFLDSMGFIYLLVELEEEYGIEIDPADAQKETMSTPEKIMAYVKSRVGK